MGCNLGVLICPHPGPKRGRMSTSQTQTMALPIVVQRSRLLMMFIELLGLAFLRIGLNLRYYHWTIDYVIPAEWIFIPLGAFMTIFGLGRVLRPARLTLTSTGLEFRHLLWTRREPWRNVRAVGLRTWRSSHTGVAIRFRIGSSLHLDGAWPMRPHDLAGLIETVRRRLG